MIENILVQLFVTIVGGFILDRICFLYGKHIEKKNKPHVFQMQLIKIFLKLNPIIRYIICFFVISMLFNVSTNIYRQYNKIDKQWVHFNWIVFKDNKIGSNFLSPNFDLYFQRGEGDRELVVRQVNDTLLVQIYNTDFDINKPNVFFSKNNIYALVTENQNVNLYNNISGELLDSFKIRDEKIEKVFFSEEKQMLYYETIVEQDRHRINKYDILTKKNVENKLLDKTIFLGITSDSKYYLGINNDTNKLLAVNLLNFNEEPIYDEEALQLCTNGVLGIVFDKQGKYYLNLYTKYSTRIEIRECSSNNIIYNTNVFKLKKWFFDEQDNLYLIHQGYVDKIDLLTGKKKTIIDLSTIAKRKGEKRVKEDYSFIDCCLINDSKYLAGIVYEPSYNYNRIYIFDMNTEEIVAMSNSIGELEENGYAGIVEYNETLYAEIIGDKRNSAIYYALVFDENKNLIFSEN